MITTIKAIVIVTPNTDDKVYDATPLMSPESARRRVSSWNKAYPNYKHYMLLIPVRD